MSVPGELDAASPRTWPAGSARLNRHGYLTDAARDTAEYLRTRAHGTPDPTTEEDAADLHHSGEPPF